MKAASDFDRLHLIAVRLQNIAQLGDAFADLCASINRRIPGGRCALRHRHLSCWFSEKLSENARVLRPGKGFRPPAQRSMFEMIATSSQRLPDLDETASGSSGSEEENDPNTRSARHLDTLCAGQLLWQHHRFSRVECQLAIVMLGLTSR